METSEFHEPVLVHEILENLHIEKNSKVIDATLGLAGHTIEFVKRGYQVLGIETDPISLEIAKNKLKQACPGEYKRVPTPFKLVNGNFKDIDKIASDNGFDEVGAILADLGVSTYQLTSDARGMSFQNPNADLDMRMSSDMNKVKASDLLNLLRVDQLQELFLLTMEYSEAKRLANKVDYKRKNGKVFRIVGDLLDIIPQRSDKKINSATLPFLALRISVNSEILNLVELLPKAFNLLANKGRLLIITFHSGEDRIVKNFFNNLEMDFKGKVITKKPIQPRIEEVENNPKSRSAKLRIFEKNDDSNI